MGTRCNALVGHLSRLAFAAVLATPALAEPKDGRVVGGSATIRGVGTTNLTISQSSQQSIINWQSFNIGIGEAVQFNQPNALSVALNRVVGDRSPSSILGNLSANGQIFLVNPEGFIFGRGATINTAGFVATTHDIKNSDFMAKRYNFNQSGNPSASIVNLGTITVADTGVAALVAPAVRNDGVITARLGKIALASANAFTLDLYGDNLIKFELNDQVANQVFDVATGKPVRNLVENRGKLSADGGTVAMTAVTARAVVDSVVNNTGVIEARSVGTRNGRIVLGGETVGSKTSGSPKQVVVVSGKLDTSGGRAGETGGTVRITGEAITLAGTIIDASGNAGGGKVLIGGDTGGGQLSPTAKGIRTAALETSPIATSTTVTVDAQTTINASAGTTGSGGKVVVWSDGATSFSGTITARGGANAGNGGFAEVSGHDALSFSGGVNLGATHGTAGTLLLDPTNVTIGNNGSWIVTVAALQAALANNSVVVNTSSPGTDAGDIAVAQSINWSNANTLTLSANRNITVLAGVTISNAGAGNLVLRSDNMGNGTGTVSFAGNGRVDFSGSTGTVSILYNPTSYATPTSFTPFVTTNGAVPNQLTAYMLMNNVTDLLNINLNLEGAYALGKDFSATGFSFAPIGAIGPSFNPFTGILDGQNYTISGLTMSSPNIYVGMIAEIGSGAIVRNLNLAGVSISSRSGFDVGALSGRNLGLVENVSISGTLTGIARNSGGFNGIAMGAIAGWNFGTIRNSSSTATISSSTTFADLGGLAGGNSGTVTNSYATGNVTGVSGAYGGPLGAFGGLVGFNETTGVIANSYATGSVTAPGSNTAAGGMVGYMRGGSIINSYATGSSSGGSPGWIGGLVGVMNNGTISKSYATGSATVGDAGNAGGLVGQMSNGTIFQSYATGAATAGHSADAGGLVGHTYGGTITQSYATGATTAAGIFSFAGALTGENYGAVVTSSYWDKQTTGQLANGRTFFPGIDGAVGLTTAQLKSGLPSGFNSSVWSISPGVTYPTLPGVGVVTTTPSGTPVILRGSSPSSDFFLVDPSGQGQINTLMASVSPKATPRAYILSPITSAIQELLDYEAAHGTSDALEQFNTTPLIYKEHTGTLMGFNEQLITSNRGPLDLDWAITLAAWANSISTPLANINTFEVYSMYFVAKGIARPLSDPKNFTEHVTAFGGASEVRAEQLAADIINGKSIAQAFKDWGIREIGPVP